MPYKILNQYPGLVVVYKPSGVLSIPARDKNDTRPVLGRMLEVDLKQTIFPVHRLDFEVSGIMLYALNAVTHKALSLAFEHQEIHKTYMAIAENHEKHQDLQEWKSLLLKGKKRTYEAPYGKPSVTHAQLLENFTYKNKLVSRWKLSPLTGRSHQLRYEMMKHQHTIIGDKLYGSQISYKENSIALLSYQIELPEKLTLPPFSLPKLLKLEADQINQALNFP
jgi:tRNA pseudouridine32 synthase/23S rRNA pseudouridine746 synthase